MNGVRKIIAGLLCCLLPALLSAQELRDRDTRPTRLQDVLRSTLEHYPAVLAASKAVEGSEGLVQAANGAFDPRLEGGAGGRLSGYYDGSSIESSLVREYPFMNSRVSAGYRVSNGDFPVYSGGDRTLDGGETRVSIAVSLLRDREIDEQRAAITDSQLDLSRQGQFLEAQKLAVMREAWVLYARWLLSARLLDAYEELLEIAINRGNAIATQVEAGDAAQILEVENNQAVLQRRGLVLDAERQLALAEEQLSLYLRDSTGRPLLPQYDASLDMPAEMTELLSTPVENLTQALVGERPEIRRLELAREQSALKLQLARNSRLPKLDFEYYLSRDLGGGPLSLAGTDNVAALSFSIPLRTRTADGKAAAASAEMQSLAHEIRLLKQQFQAQVRTARINLEATRQMEQIAIDELAMSRTLAVAENQRFEAGLSDFFLLNVRERQVGEAQLKRWRAHLEHQVALADFYAVTMAFEAMITGL